MFLGKTRILLINGSPRKYGSTAKLAAIAMKGVKDAGGEPSLVFLYDYRIKECIGCVSDDPRICRFPCIISDDDFNDIGRRVLESDGFIILSPVYWYNVTGVLKNFIDRLTSMENMIYHTGRSMLEGKVAGFIAVGNDVGGLHAIAYLMAVMNSMGVHIPPWALAYSHDKEDVLNDEQAVRDAYNVGYIVASAARVLREVKEWYQPVPELSPLRKAALEFIGQYAGEKRKRLELLRALLSSTRSGDS
ncbi:MAG: flavodoxin family protein [Thermoprotei archaeon]|nr:MAG: flavodoxin family protein [Thermoprotei archaeon]